MKQLAIGILLAALLSLGCRLFGTLTLDANNVPPPPVPEAPEELDPENAIQLAAVHFDRPAPGPDQTQTSDTARTPSSTTPASTAKPLTGMQSSDLATARTPPPAAPPAPRMYSPDGIAYHKVNASSTVSALRRNAPPPVEALAQTPIEPEAQPAPVFRADKLQTPEPSPAPKPTIAAVHGKMIGPDGIEYLPLQRTH